MKKILFVFSLSLISVGPYSWAADSKAAESSAGDVKKAPDVKVGDLKKAGDAKKAADFQKGPPKAPTAEVPPQPAAPTVADGAPSSAAHAPANKIDPGKAVSPLVPPKAPLAKGEPPGGFPKLEVPAQPKGNIDPSKIGATTVYTYKNEKGADLFADTLEAVPKQFRDKAKKVQR